MVIQFCRFDGGYLIHEYKTSRKDMVNQLSTKYKSNIDMTSSKGVMTSSKTVQVQGSESDQSTVPLVSQQKVDLVYYKLNHL
jgi:hypothetical protein